MNRKLQIAKSTETRIINSINRALFSDSLKVRDKNAKVYLIYDGNALECWLIDLVVEQEK